MIVSQKNRRREGPVRRDNKVEHVESLHSLIEVNRFERPPSMIFVVTAKEKIPLPSSVTEIPQIDLYIESYVRMSDLPKGLEEKVRKHIRSLQSKIDWEKEMHEDTWEELQKSKNALPKV